VKPEAINLTYVFDFLRSLQQSEKEGWRYADEVEKERQRLHEVNQELLEALKIFTDPYSGWTEQDFLTSMANGLTPGIHKIAKARAAIAKAEEKK
jgi:hypothetical protein